MFKKIVIGIALVSAFVGASYAFESVQKPAVKSSQFNAAGFDAEKIKSTLSETLGFEISTVKPSPMQGVAEIVTNQGIFYTSYDGKFLLQGKLYGVDKDVTNYTEESLAQVRIEGMAEFSEDMIIFPAKDEKYVVTIFTDITCGYCRKLHDQMSDYNAKGITVRYLAYPRSGIKDRAGQYSQGFNDLRSIWCHEDPQEAMTKAKSGSTVAQRICDKPIEEEFNFGRRVGVSGTPAIVFENGMMIPGYQPPDKLAAILESSL